MKQGYLNKNQRNLISEKFEKDAIREVISRYFYCLDSRDFELLKTCFTSDSKCEYDEGRRIFIGKEAIIEALRNITQFKYSHHIIGSMMIDIKDKYAKTDTYCIAFLNRENSNNNRVIIRGLRYMDELIKTGDGWKINHRIHIPLWQCEMNSSLPEFMLSQ